MSVDPNEYDVGELRAIAGMDDGDGDEEAETAEAGVDTPSVDVEVEARAVAVGESPEAGTSEVETGHGAEPETEAETRTDPDTTVEAGPGPAGEDDEEPTDGGDPWMSVPAGDEPGDEGDADTSPDTGAEPRESVPADSKTDTAGTTDTDDEGSGTGSTDEAESTPFTVDVDDPGPEGSAETDDTEDATDPDDPTVSVTAEAVAVTDGRRESSASDPATREDEGGSTVETAPDWAVARATEGPGDGVAVGPEGEASDADNPFEIDLDSASGDRSDGPEPDTEPADAVEALYGGDSVTDEDEDGDGGEPETTVIEAPDLSTATEIDFGFEESEEPVEESSERRLSREVADVLYAGDGDTE